MKLALTNPSGDGTPQQAALPLNTASPTPATDSALELDERLWPVASKSTPGSMHKKKGAPCKEPKRQYPGLLALPLLVVCWTHLSSPPLVAMMHMLLLPLAPFVGVRIYIGCFTLGTVWLSGVHGCNPWGMIIRTIMYLIYLCPQTNKCGIPLFALAVRLPNRNYFIVAFILAAHGNEESIKRGLLQLVKLVPNWCPHAFMVDCDRSHPINGKLLQTHSLSLRAERNAIHALFPHAGVLFWCASYYPILAIDIYTIVLVVYFM